MDRDREAEIEATLRRIDRPLRRPLGDYRRQKVSRTAFTGYLFSRVRGDALAGIAHGFALRRDALPGIQEPPEAVSYAFVRPIGSDLHRDLVARPRSPVRRLIQDSRALACPFEFQPDSEAVAVRHRSMARVPRELFVLSAADFFLISQGRLVAGGFARRVAAATARPEG